MNAIRLLLLLALALAITPGHAQITKTDAQTAISANLPSSGNREITALKLRQTLNRLLDYASGGDSVLTIGLADRASLTGSYANPAWITSLTASKVTQSASYRFVTDAEKASWNAKQAALGFTAENAANKATSLASPDNTKYPTTLAISTALGGYASLTGSYANPSWITSLPFTKLTGVATPAQIGTGTPAAGTYVDGATGAWTALPAGGGGGVSTSTANTWTAQQTFSDVRASANGAQLGTYGVGFNGFFNHLRAEQFRPMTSVLGLNFYSYAGIQHGKMYETGRWYIGTTPVDDGVSALNVGGRIKTTGIDFTLADYESMFTLNTNKLAVFAYGNRTMIQARGSAGGLHLGGNTNNTSVIQIQTGTNNGLYIGNGGNVPNKTEPSASLEMYSKTQGFLPPRMTAAEAIAISSPAEGLMLYVTDTNATFTSKGWWGWNGASWEKLNN